MKDEEEKKRRYINKQVERIRRLKELRKNNIKIIEKGALFNEEEVEKEKGHSRSKKLDDIGNIWENSYSIYPLF